MRRPFLFLLSVTALILGSFAAAGPAMAAVCDGASDSLGNGGFEDPAVAADTFTLFPAASVPFWATTDDLDQIEIWGDGYLGVPAGGGNAFAELNANTAGTLYQDVVSTPGATMSWTLLHRGRGGDDTMQVLIGDANDANVNGADGWDYVSPDLTDGTTAWGAHGDDYVVPAGQTCTRFAFRAVSAGSGDDSVGNFLDNVDFTVTIPAPPDPDPDPTAKVTPPPTDTIASTDGPGGGGAPLGTAVILAFGVIAGLGVLLSRTPRSRSDRGGPR